jgi:3-isopropylmalate dehydrogenase
MLVVRELTGGCITASRAASRRTAARAQHDAVFATEIERIARRAFDAARLRRKRVTSVDKMNVLETSRSLAAGRQRGRLEYPDVSLDHMLVDSCAMRIALAPASFDVIVTENMFGDILSDEAGAVVGSLGLLPSASLGDGTGLFEPVHGSAPDIAGNNIANPIGAIGSAAMLLRHALDLKKEAAAVEAAIGAALDAGHRTADLAQGNERKIGTKEMTSAIVEAIRP